MCVLLENIIHVLLSAVCFVENIDFSHAVPRTTGIIYEIASISIFNLIFNAYK